MQPQFVAVSGDQQECIVRPCTEDEHREDAGDRRVELDAHGARHLSCDDPGEGVCQADDDQRHDPQPGAAVGDQQKHRDDDDGREQQGEVRSVEDGGDVDFETLCAGEVDANPIEVCGGDVADLLCPG